MLGSEIYFFGEDFYFSSPSMKKMATTSKMSTRGPQFQGGILAGKVARILPGSFELAGEVLSKNHALLSRFNIRVMDYWHERAAFQRSSFGRSSSGGRLLAMT